MEKCQKLCIISTNILKRNNILNYSEVLLELLTEIRQDDDNPTSLNKMHSIQKNIMFLHNYFILHFTLHFHYKIS